MVGIPGLDIDSSTLELIRKYGISNFILFKRNVQDPEQLRKLCHDLINACLDAGLPHPMISIDQEGGTVTRLPPPFSQFVDARILGNSQDPSLALREYATTCARELLEVGINMNLAPVLDVCPAGQGFIMERRCLGEDPHRVAELGSVIIREMQDNGVAACGKHFPGLGAATLDPHHELPIVREPLDIIQSVDLLPFAAAIKTGVAAIMTSHTIYLELDAHNPATMSSKILTDLLRSELGFGGIVITDDLEMGAIENKGPLSEAALKAFMAGADFLLICHDHQKVIRTFHLLENVHKHGDITTGRIEYSLNRLTAVRQDYTSLPMGKTA